MTPSVIRLIQKMIAPVQRRVRLMVARAVIELVDETQTCQILQVNLQADQLRDDVERFQQYGFTSYPEAGAEALVVAVGGNSDHGVVVATEDRRYRPTDLAEGEVALYTKDDGKRVHCKADGQVLLGTSPSEFVALANLVKAELDAVKADFDSLKTALLTHTHGGVTSGGAASGPPVALVFTPHTPGEVAAAEVKAK